MSTFRERVESLLPILRQRGITSLRDWCREAEVAESYVNRRMHSTGGRPDFQMMSRLAKVAHVEPQWLAYGEGSPSGPAPVPPPGLTLERDEPPARAQVIAASETGSPLERAIGRAFDPVRHLISDATAVLGALAEIARMERSDADLTDAARAWLDAARALRIRGRDVTAAAILDEVTFGKTQRARDIDDEVGRIATEARDDMARAAGLVPGSASHVLDELAARQKRERR